MHSTNPTSKTSPLDEITIPLTERDIRQITTEEQLKLWLDTTSVHVGTRENPSEGQCCPDFSCCARGTLWDRAARQAFYDAHVSGDDATKMNMLMMGLGAIANMAAEQDVKVHVAGQTPPNEPS